MAIRLCSYPPLGQMTCLQICDVLFSVALEVPSGSAGEHWEIALWYCSDNAEWEETAIPAATSCNNPTSLQPTSSHSKLIFFSTHVRVSSSLSFTFKFRSTPTQHWRWAREELGLIEDGLILAEPIHTLLDLPDELSGVIHGLNPDLETRPVHSQTPGTRLWTVETSVAAAKGHQSAHADVKLGNPWGGFSRYFALVRHGIPWLGPRHGRSRFDIDKDALMCSFLSYEGMHLVLLGTSCGDNVTTLMRSSDDGLVNIRVRNDNEIESTGLLLAAVGTNCQSAIAAVVYHARGTLQSTSDLTHSSLSGFPTGSSDVQPQWLENWYDGLGYCTWNALGQRLSETKIIDALELLKKNKVNITNLIIDDNWQDVDYEGSDHNSYGWNSFEAEPKAFPDGLEHTISRIREKYSGIQHIAVWHALLGYWGGISPHGELAQQYQTIQVRSEGWAKNDSMTVIDKDDVDKFYNDFYRFLDSCGVDGVKTDAQFALDTIVSAKHRRELTNSYLDAWMIASLRHFSLKSISCMSQVPQMLFRQQLPQTRPAIPVRNSDDFFPNVPASHAWHLWANAHNALFTHHLNVLPDWDMFQTKHDYAGYHAAARCISGGPIYITDVPGEHDLDLIEQMTALTTHGKTVTLRPSVIGRSLNMYTGFDDDALLRVGSYHGRAITGTPILGVFNTRPHTMSEIIPLSCFPGINISNNYVIRLHRSGLVSVVADPESPKARLAVTLPAAGYDVFTAYPVTQFSSETNGAISLACLGLIGKITGAAAIMSNQFEHLSTGRVVITTRLKALGTFVLGLYISNLPQMSIERDLIITIQGQPIPVETVMVDRRDEHVLAIDVETAWKDMGLSSGWGNEFDVKTFLDIEHP
ncbi:glycoside hydrolase family 36 protein [Xylariaceae sp. FL0255]|nr:glycoside hydrolase family 36 protein [Xylariaceae sp. FL0255]